MPLIGAFKELFPGGSPLFWIVLISAIAASYVWFHWVDALKEGGRDRARLLRRLRRGGDWRDQYVWRLRRFLAHVDRFLGDTRRPGPACRWVTGGGPWPCWTARSFDICALMAVIYPFLSIYATWLWSGEAGDLGESLGLLAEPNPGARALSAATLGPMLFCSVKLARATGRAVLLWGIILLVFIAVAVAGSITVTAPVAYVVAFVVAGAVVVAVVVAGAGAGAFVVAFAFAVAVAGAVSVGIGVAVAVLYFARKANNANRLALFRFCYWPAMFAASLGGLAVLVRYRAAVGPSLLLLMLTTIPLVNLPFDWASIGVTRGLLRRGSARTASLALPFWLGIADFLIGLVLLALLACALVVTLHAADALVLAAGAEKPLVDVPKRLLALGQQPYAPENWWVYLTLFSTLIPSAFNLGIGLISLATVTFPRHRQALIRRIASLSADGKGEGGTRFEILVSLASPVFFGTFATGLLIWATVAVLGHLGGKILWWFLGHLAWVEWLMMKP